MHLRVLRSVPAIALSALLAGASLVAYAAETSPATKPSSAVPAPARAVVDANAKPLPTVPASVEDLKKIEQRVGEITRKVMPAVVGVQAGGGQGSGVIINSEGYVLTAAHVSGDPGRTVTLILADGRRVKAETLGINKHIDAGLMRIKEEGDWPHVAMGKSADLKQGQWVVALGHPGGYRRDRPPVLRLGRVLVTRGSANFVMTDCTLVGGDSGGPLFDMDGNVIGIHSRIGTSTLNNMHTPVDAYSEAWDRLAAGEVWGERFAFLTPRGPMLGIAGETVDDGALISSVTPGGPAAKAGIRPGDVVTGFEGEKVGSLEQLAQLISRKKVGDEVKVELVRNGKAMTLTARLERRPRG